MTETINVQLQMISVSVLFRVTKPLEALVMGRGSSRASISLLLAMCHKRGDHQGLFTHHVTCCQRAYQSHRRHCVSMVTESKSIFTQYARQTPFTIDTMLNFDGDFSRHGYGDVKYEQTLRNRTPATRQ